MFLLLIYLQSILLNVLIFQRISPLSFWQWSDSIPVKFNPKNGNHQNVIVVSVYLPSSVERFFKFKFYLFFKFRVRLLFLIIGFRLNLRCPTITCRFYVCCCYIDINIIIILKQMLSLIQHFTICCATFSYVLCFLSIE